MFGSFYNSGSGEVVYMEKMKVIAYSNGPATLWNEYVQKHDYSTFCHLYGWKNVIEKSFGYKSYYVLAENNIGITGILPLVVIRSKIFGSYLVSMPFVDYGGILSDNQEISDILLREAEMIANTEKIDFLELRYAYPNISPFLKKLNKVNLKLPLSTELELWNGFRPEIRNRINKATKSSLVFEVSKCKEVKQFYYVFSRAMRDMGTPVMPLIFFEEIFRQSDLNCELFMVKRGSYIIGSAIAVYFRDQIELPWITCLKEYFDLCPNNFLYWEGMKRGIEKGIKCFNFGRSSKDSSHYFFKKRWGALDQQLFYQYRSYYNNASDLDPNSPKYKLAVNIWKKMPLSITNFLGPYIARKIP